MGTSFLNITFPKSTLKTRLDQHEVKNEKLFLVYCMLDNKIANEFVSILTSNLSI